MDARKSPPRGPYSLRAGLPAAAMLLLVVATGCSTVFERPELLFRGIRVNSIGFAGASLEILVDVYNPNSYRLGLARLSYDLAIEDVHWGLGSVTSPVGVDGGETATLRLPLDVSWSRLGGVGRQALRSGIVNYGVSGQMTVATSLGDVEVPYSKSGRFSVFSGQESSDPGPFRPDPTSRFQRAVYSTETATPFSKTTFFPTLL